MSVPQFTTPTFVLTFDDEEALDLTEANNVYVTFQAKTYLLTKTGDDLIVDAKSIGVKLSQNETSHMPIGDVEIQANWTTQNGDRAASEVVTFRISKQLLQRVVE